MLAAIGSVAAFYGASELLTHKLLDVRTILPLLAGLAVTVLLVVYQYRARRPLLIVRPMFGSTIPVAGLVLALFAAATAVSAIRLTVASQAGHYSPVHLGLLYLPELAGAVLSAALLGLMINRRGLQMLPVVGMIFLAAGIAIFRIELPPGDVFTLIGSGVTGIGLGASVVPALFSAGFSLPSKSLQRVFALVELMRAMAAFMIAPIFAHFAVGIAGTGAALSVAFGLALAGGAIAVLIYLAGGARPQTPDVERFVRGHEPAWDSPPLFARVRRR